MELCISELEDVSHETKTVTQECPHPYPDECAIPNSAGPEEISVEETAVGGGGEQEEESGFIFPSSYVENDITISVEYGTITLQTEER